MSRKKPRDLSLSRRDVLAVGAAGALGIPAWKSRASSPSHAFSSLEEPASLQPTEGGFDYAMPYRSKRAPVMAENVVATSQPLAAQAGIEMLRKGGNAIDAAVATAAALTVVEPTSNGIGSDCFALIWSGGKLHGLNGSGKSPRALDVSRFEGKDRIPFYGWDGVTTPGTPAGWADAHAKFGELPFETVLEPAIRYASDGFMVSPEVAKYWANGARGYQGNERFDAWQRTFAPGGKAPNVGDRVTLKGHAETLRKIAQSAARDFYEGDLARAIDAESRRFGGDLRLADLEAHASRWVEPISTTYNGHRLHEIPPNGQGLTALIALGILRHIDSSEGAFDAPSSLHRQIEAMKLAFRDADRYIADPDHMDVDVASLLDDTYLRERASQISTRSATDFVHGEPKLGGTVLLCTADNKGNMVSWIQSNYTGFGSGMVIAETGIAMQNRGCCFTLEEGHPNQAAPDKYPYHTIIPAFVTRDNAEGGSEPVMAYGVMGGYMQPQGHVQVLTRMLDANQNPQAALDAPRWQVQKGMRVTIEPGYDDSVYDELLKLGHDLRRSSAPSASFGRGQTIWKTDGGYIAGSDMRADGQAVGY